MKLRNVATAIALSSVFSFAFAQTVTPVVFVTPTSSINAQNETVYSAGFNATHQGNGSFTDTFNFGSFANPSLASASLTATLVGFTATGYSLISGTLGSSALTFGTQGKNVTALFTDNDVMFSGPLQLTVTGKTINGGGSFGGNVNIAMSPSISAVPEPETYAMMLAGLGLLGFAARRKAKANQS